MKPHIWQKEIIAWANGETIQYESSENGWLDDKSPCWDGGYMFRVKPEPKPDLVVYAVVKEYYLSRTEQEKSDNLKLTFDGETGELKDAEVLK